jgi:hypothetical protein
MAGRKRKAATGTAAPAAELRRAFFKWVSSLSASDAGRITIREGNRGYSPLDIKDEVRRKTPFGLRLLRSMLRLHMTKF